MPVKLLERRLSPRDIQYNVDDNTYNVPLGVPHHRINASFYGYLEPSSPVYGLYTNCLTVGIAIIFHCAETAKTCLFHALVPLCKTAMDFRTQLAYVTNGLQNVLVEVVVMKGACYTPEYAEQEYWSTTADALKQRFKFYVETDSNCLLTLHYPETNVESGCLMVEKETGYITVLSAPPNRRDTVLMISEKKKKERDEALSEQLCFDVAVLNDSVHACIIQNGNAAMNLGYDGLRAVVRPPILLNQGRTLLRHARKYLSKYATLKEMDDELVGLYTYLARRCGHQGAVDIPRLMKALQYLLREESEWCEVCGKTGDLVTCKECAGAKYCGERHQKENYGEHKTWCTANAV